MVGWGADSEEMMTGGDLKVKLETARWKAGMWGGEEGLR